MSNPVVQKFRAAFPNSKLTDAEVTLSIYDATRENPVFDSDKEFLNQALDFKLALGASRPGNELSRSFSSGVDVAQAKLYDTAALAGRMTSIKSLEEFGNEGYDRNIEAAQENAPTIPNIGNARNLSELARYTIGLGASQGPQIAGTLAGSVAGGAAGFAVAGPAGVIHGAAIGGGAAGFTQMQSFGELSRQPGVDQGRVVTTALGVGVLGAVLEALVPLKVTSALLRGASKEVAKEYIGRVMTKVPLNALAEGSTEVAQEVVVMAGELYANQGNPQFALTDAEIRNRLINAGAAGALLGAPLGAVEAIPGLPDTTSQVSETSLTPPPPVASSPAQPAPPAQTAPILPAPPVVVPPEPSARNPLDPSQNYSPVTLAEDDIARTLTQSGSVASSTFTDNGLKRVLGIPDAVWDVQKNQLIDAGLLIQNGTEYTFSDSIISKATPTTKPAEVVTPEVTPVEPTNRVVESAVEPPLTSVEQFNEFRAAESAASVEQQRLQAEAERLRQRRAAAVELATAPEAEKTVVPSATQTPAAATPATPPAPEITIHPLVDEINFARRVQTVQEKEEGVEVKRPSLFIVTDIDYSPELGERLTNDARSKKPNGLNTETHRTTFFENQETGAVVGLPTYYTKAKGRGVIYRVSPLPGETKGGTIEEAMARGWIPLANIYTNEPRYALDQKNIIEFADAKEFEQKFLRPAVERQRAEAGVEESDATTEEIQQQPGMTVVNKDDAAYGKSREDGVRVTAADAETIFDAIGNVTWDNEEGGAEIIEGALLTIPSVLKRIAGSNPETFQRFYDSLLEVYESARQQIESGSLDPAELRSKLVSSIKGLGKRKVRKQAGASEEIIEPSEDGGESESEQRFNLTAKDSGPVVIAEFMATAKALADAGVPVNIFKQVAGGLMGGVYDLSTKTVTFFLSDPANPRQSSLRIAFEEAGHVLFDREPPDAMDSILRAVGRLSDADLGLTKEQFDSIMAARPEGVTDDVLQEERLMAVVSTNLTKEGFSPIQSRGIAQAIMRFLKDLYLRGLMAIQKMILGEQYSNPAIAQRYFQNRIEAFLARDSASLPSFIERLGGGKPLPSREVSFYSPANGNQWTVEQYNYDTNSLEYQPMIQDTVEAVAFNVSNALRFSVPTAGVEFADPGIGLNIQAATNNWMRDVQAKAAARTTLPVQKIRKIFGLGNTDAYRQLLTRQAAGANVENFRPDQKLDDFRRDENRRPVMEQAYNNTSEQANSIGRQQAEAMEMAVSKKAEKLMMVAKYAKTIEGYNDSEGVTKDIVDWVRTLTRETIADFRRGSRRLGRIEQQIAALEGQIDKPIPREYGAVFRKLFTGDQLNGEKLFTYLDRLANMATIDFTRPIMEIRDVIRSAAEAGGSDLAPLIEGREGRALLATVVAYAKTTKLAKELLELRKLGKLDDKAAINTMLQDLKTEKLPGIIKGIGSVAMIAALEERTRLAARDALRDIANVDKAIKRADAKAKIAEQILPEYQKAIRDLESRMELSANFVIHDQAKIIVPEKPEATRSEIAETPAKILTLSSVNGAPTDPKMVSEWTDQMTFFLDYREQQAKLGDTLALDSDYWYVKRQRDELMGWKFDPLVQATDHVSKLLFLDPASTQMDSFGTSASRQAGQMFRIFSAEDQRLKNIGTKLGIATVQAGRRVLTILASGLKNGMRQDFYNDTILQPATGFLELRNKSFIEEFTGTPSELRDALALRLQNYLLSNDSIKPFIADRINEFMPALIAHIESIDRANEVFQKESGAEEMGVQDPRFGGKVRRPFGVGPISIARTINPEMVKAMITALDNSGWAPDPKNEGKSLAVEDFGKVAELYNAGDVDGVAAILNRYFKHPKYGNTVERFFVRELANMPDASVFNAPVLEDGVTRPPANAGLVTQAYDDANGEILPFIEGVYALHEGTGDKGQFIQETLERMAEVYFEARSIKNKVDPDPSIKVTSLTGMIPGVFIDARSIEHLPDSWFRYHSFDPMDNKRIAERIAGQKAYGRNQERLQTQFETVAAEVASAVSELERVKAEVKAENPSRNKKSLQRSAEQKVGSKAEYDRLETIAKRAYLLPLIRDGLITYFRKGNDPVLTLNWATRLAQFLAGLSVNQISSALSQLATVFDPNLRYGASPTALKATASIVVGTAKELANSLSQGIGFEIFKNSDEENDFNRIGLNDAETERRFGDIFAPYEGEDKFIGALRKGRDIQNLGINRMGDRAQHALFRPLAPFSTSVIAVNKALTVAMWRLAKKYVSRGVKYATANPDLEAGFELTPEQLGLRGLEKDSFLRFQADLGRYGLDFNDMVRGAKQRMSGDKVALTDKELSRLYSMGLNEVSLENNIATMPLSAFNNSVLRFILPLLGWSFRRSLQIGALRLDESGKKSMASLSKGLVGLAAVAGGSLALSALIDDYQERILGKARNLRKLKGIPDTAQDWLAIVERTGRMGTTGLFGELANAAINVGTGQGDNRALSVDGRVLALNNIQSLIRAASSFINQDFNADYSHVVRPFITSIGGGGMLQYMQLANNAFGLDNVESRVTARINASNYLRVAGRELGLNIRAGQAGYGSPTPITPFIAAMEYAAYANDPAGFRSAFETAKAKAKGAGKPEPEDYVKRSFETRHPLRFVFQTVPSTAEYAQILGALNDNGREDVSTAVRLFNFYGAKLGLKPMEGREPKNKSSPSNLRSLRERAVLSF